MIYPNQKQLWGCKKRDAWPRNITVINQQEQPILSCSIMVFVNCNSFKIRITRKNRHTGCTTIIKLSFGTYNQMHKLQKSS